MKNKIFSLALPVTLVGLTVFSSVTTQVAQSSPLAQVPQAESSSLDRLNTSVVADQITALQKYMQVNNTTKIVKFDSEAAKRDGFSKDIIDLATELVTNQNALIEEAKKEKTRDITKVPVSEDKFPKLKKFYQRLKEKDLKNKQLTPQTPPPEVPPDAPPPQSLQPSLKVASNTLSKGIGSSIKFQKPIKSKGSKFLIAAATAYACGDYNHHIPNYTPYTTGWYNSVNPDAQLRKEGFYLTPYYAAYQNSFGLSYTRARSYSSSYGTCDSPFFRDEGKLNTTKTAFRRQYGEPNPDVLNMSYWPYATWPNYVKYWHTLY